MLTRDAVREIAQDVGWKAARRPAGLELDPWVYLTKQIQDQKIILHCHCREGSIWIGSPEDAFLTSILDAEYNMYQPKSPVLDVHISDPESIIKIQKYLRDRC